MADSTPTATPSNDIVSSSFRRTVTLYDWWLVIAKNDFQGKRLAVAGVSSRKDEATRVFVSAAVIKRYDVFSLETADGICVIIRGFINEQRTLENGFSAEVFHHFLFGFPPDWERYALDCFKEEPTTDADLGSVVPDNAPASCPKILSDGVEKSIPTCLVSPEEASGDHEMSFPENECNVSKEMGGVHVACSSGGKSHSFKLHNIKVCQQKKQPASECLPNHPDNENSSSVALENCNVERLESPTTPIQPQLWSEYSNDACVENAIPTSLASEEAPGDHEKSFPENESNVSKEINGVNVACSSGGKSRSARLHDIKVYQQKKPASGGSLKHPNNENSTSVALENCDVKGLKSPATPIQSQSSRQLSTSPGQVIKKSASKISRTLSPKTEGCYKKKRVTVETKVVMPKGKLNKSASALKNPREKDLSPLAKGSQQKISTFTPESLSFRKSRSGRLLLPPLEFWRNQIPIYNADHEITEIRDGASLISPCRGFSPSLSRCSCTSSIKDLSTARLGTINNNSPIKPIC
uniref:SANTA domain-containing protein n=1 Tax=Glycine max TaxID=3847 RepID=A0A0R0GW77_SOYBN|eukprot:XP_025980978.1 kinetochore-associated protein KNL-2 homolog isoform X2 [Glycine max]